MCHSSPLLYFLGIREKVSVTYALHRGLTFTHIHQYTPAIWKYPLIPLEMEEKVKINSPGLFASFCFSIFVGKERYKCLKAPSNYITIFYDNKMAIFLIPFKLVSMLPSSFWSNLLVNNYSSNHQLCKEPMGFISGNPAISITS